MVNRETGNVKGEWPMGSSTTGNSSCSSCTLCVLCDQLKRSLRTQRTQRTKRFAIDFTKAAYRWNDFFM